MEASVILKKYRKASIVVRQWFLQKMLDSLNSDNLPEDFKEVVKNEGISDDRIAYFLDSSPRTFFDVFDIENIHVEMTRKDDMFWWKIDEESSENGYFSRKEAESAAIERAFNILNSKL